MSNYETVPEIWTTKEIAAVLGLSQRHVAERIIHERGFPPPIRSGKYLKKRWLKDAIFAWMNKA